MTHGDPFDRATSASPGDERSGRALNAADRECIGEGARRRIFEMVRLIDDDALELG